MKESKISNDTSIVFGKGLPSIPERLLLAHARGDVIFICGAGISKAAKLPDFQELVLNVYKTHDPPLYEVLKVLKNDSSNLNPAQKAETDQFLKKNYDVVLGMLERRLDGSKRDDSSVRKNVITCLREKNESASIHSSLIHLSNRGGAVAIVTTNFDLLLENASKRLQSENKLFKDLSIESYSLGAIPRPSKNKYFSGIFHIHGALADDPNRISELILSDQDFGEFYLRRQFISNFIYDLSRLYHIVFVGYSVDDPPMQYLLKAIDADAKKFDDLKEKFIFYELADPVKEEMWKHRGITPIPYDSKDKHKILTQTFKEWAKIFPVNEPNYEYIRNNLGCIENQTKNKSSPPVRDLFNHLLRRGSLKECIKFLKPIPEGTIGLELIDDIINILIEKEGNSKNLPPHKWNIQVDPHITKVVSNLLKKHLENSDTVNWALDLLDLDENSPSVPPSEKCKKQIILSAITQLLLRSQEINIQDPWLSVWKLIEESWSQNFICNEIGETMDLINDINDRLGNHDYSKAVIDMIVGLVTPRLQIKKLSNYGTNANPLSPREIDDIIDPHLTSGEWINLKDLDIKSINKTPFLMELAQELDFVIHKGLYIGRRIGWNDDSNLLRLGELNRSYCTQLYEDDENDQGSDNKGIAPAVKLLHRVVQRIDGLDTQSALPLIQCWRIWNSPIHVRLWAAIGCTSNIIPVEEIGKRLTNMEECDEYHFWCCELFPEISMLRAKRFKDMNQSTQKILVNRLQKRPLKVNLGSSDKEKYKDYCTLREFQRIKVAGSTLPPDTNEWLEKELNKPEYVHLKTMQINYAFPERSEAKEYPASPEPDPNNEYDRLCGRSRLKTLEQDLSNKSDSTYDDANNWMGQPGKIRLIITDLKSEDKSEDKIDDFSSVWKCLLEKSLPYRNKNQQIQLLPPEDIVGILSLLKSLSRKTLLDIIDQVCTLFQNYCPYLSQNSCLMIMQNPLILEIWKLLWPLAVEKTDDSVSQERVKPCQETFYNMGNNYDRMPCVSIETLIDIFISICKIDSQKSDSNVFSKGNRTHKMKMCINEVIQSNKPSHLVVRYLIKELSFLFNIDKDWTEEHLIKPLHKCDNDSRILWSIIAPKVQGYTDELFKMIGQETILTKINDPQIDSKIRRSLSFGLTIKYLSLTPSPDSTPIISGSDFQQMLRTADDEIRVHVACSLRENILNYLNQNPRENFENFFESAVRPFITDVWPQELSLSSRKISNEFAALPGVCGEKFADAVQIIERFLQPCDCNLMINYNLYYKHNKEEIWLIYDNSNSNSNFINNESKAKSLLKLLDLTIGTSENATIPHNLSGVLEVIRRQSPDISNVPAFQRLSATVRR